MTDLMTVMQIKIFLCGFIGSASVEVLTILKYYQNPGRFPMRYKKVGFWFTRTSLALFSGFFAVIIDPSNLLLAVHIGVSTPLIVSKLTETLPNDASIVNNAG